MKNISFEENNYENKDTRKYYNEFVSLKENDVIYKKNIGKFLKTLSSHFL